MKDLKNTFNLITIGSIIFDVIVVVLGLFFVTNPTVGTTSALMLIGILLSISGIVSIIKYIINPKNIFNFELVYGILSIIFGIFAFAKPIAVEILIVNIVGAWLIISSVIKLMMAIELRKVKENTWVFDLTVAILTIILGIFIIVNPFSGYIVLSTYIGVLMMIYAAMDIIEQLFIRKRVKTIVKLISK